MKKNKQKVETMHVAYGKMFEQLKPVISTTNNHQPKGYPKNTVKKGK